MKFKVGDRVKFVKNIEIHSNKVRLGNTYKIEHIERSVPFMPYKVENGEWFSENELELAEYTYEDLKKSPIGTKITFEKGNILVRTCKNKFENETDVSRIAELGNLTDRYYGKIIKIEEPTYQTVYEAKVEILDNTEKKYLRGVIRPFRNKVLKIVKKYDTFTELEYIRIIIKDDSSVEFPSFSKNTMYKGMETNKSYTLEELGI